MWGLNTTSLKELQAWVKENRHVKEFSCQERVQYQIEPLCEEVAVPEPDLMPPTPKEAGYVQPVYDAQVGENRGEIAVGEWDIWLYEGQAGEVLTVTMIADNPAQGFTYEEKTIPELLDTFIYVISPEDDLMAMNDTVSNENLYAMAPGLVLPVDGTYQIQARSWEDSSAGAYTLIIEVAEE